MSQKNDHKTLKTFDMYSHLSRPTVIMALLFVVLAVLVMLFGFLISGQII